MVDEAVVKRGRGRPRKEDAERVKEEKARLAKEKAVARKLKKENRTRRLNVSIKEVDGVHPLLNPVRIGKAICQGKLALCRLRKGIVAAGLPVPLCMESIQGVSYGKRVEILAARGEMAKVWEAASQGVESRAVRSKGGVRKRKAVSEGAGALLGAVEAAGEATPPDPKVLASPRPDPDARPDKPPKKDPNRLEVNNQILPSLVPFDSDMSDRTYLLVGPMGSGKSTAAVVKMLKHAATVHPDGARYVLVRNTYRELWDTVAKTFFKVVPQNLGWLDKKDEVFHLGKWEFFFRACERPEDVDKFKGLEITGYWIDEASEVKRDVKDLLDGRLGRYPLMWSRNDATGEYDWRGTEHTLQTLTTNPCDEEHWLYQMFVANPLEGHDCIQQPAGENDHNLPKGYYQKMREKYRDNPDFLQRYVEGKWGATYRGKAVFPEYDSRFHLAKEPQKWIQNVPVVRGWDFGRTPACVWTQVRPDGCWVILAEMFTTDMGIDQFAGAVLSASNQWFAGAEFVDFCDPAGFDPVQTDSSSCVDIMGRMGIFPRQGARNLTPRLESVKKRLRMTDRGKPMLLVNPSCKMIAGGLGGGYCYAEIGRTGIHSDKPEKNRFSHLADALQYAATGLFSVERRPDEERMLEMLESQFGGPINSEVGY